MGRLSLNTLVIGLAVADIAAVATVFFTIFSE